MAIAEQTSAANAFARYLHKPEQLAKLARAGFRVSDVKPPRQPRHQFPSAAFDLSVGDDSIHWRDTMVTASAGVAATIMLDQSMPNDEGGNSRLSSIVTAARTDQGDAAQFGRRTVDIRRPRGPNRGAGRAVADPVSSPARPRP